MTQRVILRLAFDGHAFQGTQRQPDASTLHGTLLGTLEDANLLTDPPKLRAHGRLDAGVSALDHPVALDVETDLHTVARTLAGATKGIIPWAGASVHPGHDPRFAARSRTYQYTLPTPDEGLMERLQDAWSVFHGRHDVREFARIDRERGQRTRVRMDARSWRQDEGVVFEVTSPRFLHHQVRRMVGTARCLARGEVERDRVHDALEGGTLGMYEVAPPSGLVLARVALSAPWVTLDEARRIGQRRLGPRWERTLQHASVLNGVQDVGGVRRPG